MLRALAKRRRGRVGVGVGVAADGWVWGREGGTEGHARRRHHLLSVIGHLLSVIGFIAGGSTDDFRRLTAEARRTSDGTFADEEPSEGSAAGVRGCQ